jgi:hypothetical protein
VCFESELFEVAAMDRRLVDVIDEGIYSFSAAEVFQVREAESCCSRKSASLIATGSGRGFATGPSQHSRWIRQSRQIPVWKSKLCGCPVAWQSIVSDVIYDPRPSNSASCCGL